MRVLLIGLALVMTVGCSTKKVKTVYVPVSPPTYAVPTPMPAPPEFLPPQVEQQ